MEDNILPESAARPEWPVLKPGTEETRAALKQNGFRWSPRYSAWQRQLTPNAEAAARRALGLTE